jgi:hypothetical protein
MRSAAIFTRCLGFVLLIVIAHFYEPLLCWAQAKEPMIPKVSLTIFLVPKKEACKPYGYQAYDVDESTNCAPLTMKHIDGWREAGFLSQTITIPPSEILLTN